jgi:hypothetical protein
MLADVRSVVMSCWIAMAACGTTATTLRIGSVLIGPREDRAFVTVERWNTVRDPIPDSDDRRIEHDLLTDAWVVELDLAHGDQRVRAHADVPLAPIAYVPAERRLWLVRGGFTGAGRKPSSSAVAVTGLAPRDSLAPPPGFERGPVMLVAGRIASDGPLAPAAMTLWDIGTGRTARIPAGWLDTPNHARMSADHRVIGWRVDGARLVHAVLDLDRALATGEGAVAATELRVPGDAPVTAADVSPDGSRLAAIAGTTVTVFDVATRSIESTMAVPRPAYQLAFAGAGTLVVAREDGAWVIDIARRTRSELPGCCHWLAPIDPAGSVLGNIAGRGERGVLIAADGTVTRLGSEAEVRLAEQTGQSLSPVAPPASHYALLAGGSLLVAGVDRDRAIVRVESAGATSLRVTLALHDADPW